MPLCRKRLSDCFVSENTGSTPQAFEAQDRDDFPRSHGLSGHCIDKMSHFGVAFPGPFPYHQLHRQGILLSEYLDAALDAAVAEVAAAVAVAVVALVVAVVPHRFCLYAWIYLHLSICAECPKPRTKARGTCVEEMLECEKDPTTVFSD